LCKAPATDGEFNVLRTACDLRFGLTFALRVALPVELSGVLWPTEVFAGAWAVTDRLPRKAVPRELDDTAERDLAGLALM
jgi:hypothetical protein